MRSFARATVAALALLANVASAIVVHPGTAADLVITSENTVNASAYPSSSESSTTSENVLPIVVETTVTTTTAGQLNLSLVNNLDSDSVNAYVTGLDINGLLVLLQPNGSWYYPTADDTGIPKIINASIAVPLGPQGSITVVTLPSYISAGRIWFADGELSFYTVEGGDGPSLVEPSAVNPEDPSADVNWGFVELTWIEDGGLYANLSYVDFVGLPLGMALTNTAGTVVSANGLSAGAVTEICDALTTQAATDDQPWNELCVTDTAGVPLRVLSPTQYLSLESDAWDTYWDAYIDEVWAYYNTTPLIIETQAAAGNVNCTTNGTYLNCAGDNRGYAMPTATDIFGCNGGPFAIEGTDNAIHYAVVPRLCAAFHRSTFLLDGGEYQPSLNASFYYQGSPMNWYSKVVHSYEIDSKGYAFAYDDVTPTGAVDQSGLLADPSPVLLAITVGGPVATSSTLTTVSSTATSTSTSKSAAVTTSASTSQATSKSSSSSSSSSKTSTTAKSTSVATSSSKASSTSSKTSSSSVASSTSSKSSSSSSKASSSSTSSKVSTTSKVSSISTTTSSVAKSSSTSSKTSTAVSSSKATASSSTSKAASVSSSKTSSKTTSTSTSKTTAQAASTSSTSVAADRVVTSSTSSEKTSTKTSTTIKTTTSSKKSSATTTTSSKKSSTTSSSKKSSSTTKTTAKTGTTTAVVAANDVKTTTSTKKATSTKTTTKKTSSSTKTSTKKTSSSTSAKKTSSSTSTKKTSTSTQKTSSTLKTVVSTKTSSAKVAAVTESSADVLTSLDTLKAYLDSGLEEVAEILSVLTAATATATAKA